MYFVTFEGIDLSGKTTQIDLLKKEFQSKKDIVFTANPGDTALGKELRKMLLHKADLKLSEINEMFLFFTGIQDNYEKVVLPAIANEKIVFCDRYFDSTIAYQGFGRKLNMDKILELVKVTGLPEPNLTFLFRIDVDTFNERSSNRSSKDKIESSKGQFYKYVIEGYDELSKIYKSRYIVLDGTKSVEMINREVKQVLADRLGIK